MISKAVQSSSKAVKFYYDNAAVNWLRKFSWKCFWGGREYGLQFHDTYFEPSPEVTEALRRLNMKEPWLFDERKIRLSRAHTLAMHGERLPKNKWTNWEEETWYLKPYLDEIEAEKKARIETSGLIPGFEMKQSH